MWPFFLNFKEIYNILFNLWPSYSNTVFKPDHQNLFSVSASETSQARDYNRDRPDQTTEDVSVTSTQRQWHFVSKKKKKNITVQIDVTAKFCIHPEHGGHGSCQQTRNGYKEKARTKKFGKY